MKTILVPTDFSESANNALNYAIELAKADRSRILLLHVYHIDPSSTFMDDTLTTIEMDAEEKKWIGKLRGLQSKIDHAGGVGSEVIARLNLAVDGIVQEAEDQHADLIVMGTTGASGLGEALLGSNTARVIERATCPVIAVPDGASYSHFKKISYACNYNNSEIKAIESLVDLAQPFGAQVNILHVYESDEATAKEEMKEFMHEIEREVVYPNLSFELINGKDIEASLEHYVNSGATDLIVLSSHKRDFLDKIFGKSITRKLVSHSKTPVMAFHYLRKEPAMIL